MNFSVILFVSLVMSFSTHIKPGPINGNHLKNLYQQGKISLIQEVKIDNDSLPEGVVLKQISDIAQNKLSQLFITDSSQNNIKVFDPQGKYIKTFGRKGQGPGDLMRPASLCFNRKHLIVWEQGNNRFSLFTENGDFIKIIKPLSNLQIKNIKAIPGGDLIVEKELNLRGEKYGQTCILDLFSADLQALKSLYKQNLLRSTYITDPIRIKVAVPFCQDVAWDVMSNGHVVVGFQKKYKIDVLDREKGKLFSFQHHAEPVKITTLDKERIFNSYRVFTGPGKMKEPPKALLEKIPFPEYRPAFGQIFVDPEDNILVFPMMDTNTEQYRYFDAFDSGGGFIKRVEIASQWKVPFKILFSSIAEIWCFDYDPEEGYMILKYQISIKTKVEG